MVRTGLIISRSYGISLVSLKAKLGGELDFSDTLTYELKCEDVEIRQEEKVRGSRRSLF